MPGGCLLTSMSDWHAVGIDVAGPLRRVISAGNLITDSNDVAHEVFTTSRDLAFAGQRYMKTPVQPAVVPMCGCCVHPTVGVVP